MLAMRLERLSQCFMGSMKTNDVHSCVCSRPDVTRPLITAKLASLSLSLDPSVRYIFIGRFESATLDGSCSKGV